MSDIKKNSTEPFCEDFNEDRFTDIVMQTCHMLANIMDNMIAFAGAEFSGPEKLSLQLNIITNMAGGILAHHRRMVIKGREDQLLEEFINNVRKRVKTMEEANPQAEAEDKDFSVN